LPPKIAPLGADEEMPRYAKWTNSSKRDPYAEKLATRLVIEVAKSRKQRRNLRQTHTPKKIQSTLLCHASGHSIYLIAELKN